MGKQVGCENSCHSSELHHWPVTVGPFTSAGLVNLLRQRLARLRPRGQIAAGAGLDDLRVRDGRQREEDQEERAGDQRSWRLHGWGLAARLAAVT